MDAGGHIIGLHRCNYYNKASSYSKVNPFYKIIFKNFLRSLDKRWKQPETR